MAGIRSGIVVALLLPFAASPAIASGGFDCETDDGAMALVLQGGLSRSIPGMPFNFAAEAIIKLPGTPEDFRSLDLGERLAQYWILGPDLRLQLYHERDGDPFGWVNIVIVAIQSEEEWMYHGTYTLEVGEVPADGDTAILEAIGAISCSVE